MVTDAKNMRASSADVALWPEEQGTLLASTTTDTGDAKYLLDSKELKAITASIAWRLAKPIYKVEKELARFRRRVGRGRNYLFPQKFVRASSPTVSAADIERLKTAYQASPISAEPDTFVLFRIIGNDLMPRHRRWQSRDNVAFTLANEPQLDHCEKRWVVNRIFDRSAEAAIIDLLQRNGQRYLHIPFSLDDYAAVGWAFEDFPDPGLFLHESFDRLDDEIKDRAEAQLRRHKNNYVMNNNGARNSALIEGRKIAKWVLPWDGNCFLTAAAWQDIRRTIATSAFLRYFIVPMARVTDNQAILTGFQSSGQEEPQIVFRKDTEIVFDERFPYGRRPKVEMLWRLGVPGTWDRGLLDPWDVKSVEPLPEAGRFGKAGWVARLASGRPELETGERSISNRMKARTAAIIETLDHLDHTVISRRLDPSQLTFYYPPALDALAAARSSEQLATQLRMDAEEALCRGPYSVIDKPAPPPGGKRHDYWTPAPYWWPNPDTADGLPYIRRDGQRIAESVLYSPESDRFDRSRLQRLFEDTTVLALAWRVHRDARYAEHAAALIRHWFVNPRSAVTPHLRFAQVRQGHNQNEGTPDGIIEAKDMYYFLDAVRLTASAGALNAFDLTTLRSWLQAYVNWLENSFQGRQARRAVNNQGTMYDLQLAAIAAALKNPVALAAALRRAHERLLLQFDASGAQPLELSRPMSRHYCCFNMQGWTALARLAGSFGENLWHSCRSTLGNGLEWCVATVDSERWRWPDMSRFDPQRLLPLRADLDAHYRGAAPTEVSSSSGRPRYPSDTGIAPYWMLGRP